MRKILVPPVLLLLCIIGIVFVQNSVTTAFALGKIAFWVGVALTVSGIALPIWGAQVFRIAQTNILPYKDPDKMVRNGPFRFSRNPMYLGMLCIITGAAMMSGMIENFAFSALFFCVANWWYIPFEEGRMRAAFGENFDEYAAAVRRWI